MAIFRPADILSTPLPANIDKAVLAEQKGLWRCTSIGDLYPCIQRRFLLQMVQYLPDDHGVFDTSNDVHGRTNAVGAWMLRNSHLRATTAGPAGFNVNIEHSFQSLSLRLIATWRCVGVFSS
jgi:hypothetical protein